MRNMKIFSYQTYPHVNNYFTRTRKLVLTTMDCHLCFHIRTVNFLLSVLIFYLGKFIYLVIQ